MKLGFIKKSWKNGFTVSGVVKNENKFNGLSGTFEFYGYVLWASIFFVRFQGSDDTAHTGLFDTIIWAKKEVVLSM